MCENIFLQCLKNIQINLKYIHFPLSLTFQLIFFCKSKKLYFSCYNDVDTDGYACSHILRMYLRMRILMRMRIRMRTGLFPTLPSTSVSYKQWIISSTSRHVASFLQESFDEDQVFCLLCPSWIIMNHVGSKMNTELQISEGTQW